MPIKITCQECGKALRVADDYAGRRAKCPACGAVIPIPAAGRARTRPAAHRAASPPTAAGEAPQKPRQAQKRSLPAEMPPLPPPDEDAPDLQDS